MYEHLLYEHRSAVLIIITDLSIKLGPLLLGWRIGDSGFRIQILHGYICHPGAQAVAPGDLSRLGAETLALVGGKSSPPTTYLWWKSSPPTTSSPPPRIIAVNWTATICICILISVLISSHLCIELYIYFHYFWWCLYTSFVLSIFMWRFRE